MSRIWDTRQYPFQFLFSSLFAGVLHWNGNDQIVRAWENALFLIAKSPFLSALVLARRWFGFVGFDLVLSRMFQAWLE